jgi:hypothetical protein
MNRYCSLPSLDTMCGVQVLLQQFKRLNLVIKCYSMLLVHPLLGLPDDTKKSFLSKLQDTVITNGLANFANIIIQRHFEAYQLSLNDTNLSNANQIANALKTFTLLSPNRYEFGTRLWRCLLRELCRFCDSEKKIILERIWRDVMACHIQDVIGQHLLTKFSSFDSEKSKEIISKLIALLKRIRSLSHVDMEITKITGISADLAFEMAFRRLPREQYTIVTKIIVVYISSTIDSFKSPVPSPSNMSHSSNQLGVDRVSSRVSSDSVVELIQVSFWLNFLLILIVLFCFTFG